MVLRCQGRRYHQTRKLVASVAACATALRHAADETMLRADPC